MSLEDIKKKILKDAHQERDSLLEQAKARKKDILKDYDKKSQEIKAGLAESARAEADAIQRGIIIDARQRLNNEILARKRQILADSFQAAMRDFLNSEDYPALMTRLVSQAVQGRDSEIILAATEKKLDKNWISKTAQAAGVKLQTATEKGGFQGGVIVQQGTDYVNITVEALFDSIKEEAEKNLAEILF